MSASKMLRQAGSFSKITSMAPGQRVLRCGVLPGAGMYIPGGNSGRCESSGSTGCAYSLLLASSDILCDIILVILLFVPVLSCFLKCRLDTRWMSRAKKLTLMVEYAQFSY